MYINIAERRERSKRSEANNGGLFEIPRYLCIYIYMSVCLGVVLELSASVYIG